MLSNIFCINADHTLFFVHTMFYVVWENILKTYYNATHCVSWCIGVMTIIKIIFACIYQMLNKYRGKQVHWNQERQIARYLLIEEMVISFHRLLWMMPILRFRYICCT